MVWKSFMWQGKKIHGHVFYVYLNLHVFLNDTSKIILFQILFFGDGYWNLMGHPWTFTTEFTTPPNNKKYFHILTAPVRPQISIWYGIHHFFNVNESMAACHTSTNKRVPNFIATCPQQSHHRKNYWSTWTSRARAIRKSNGKRGSCGSGSTWPKMEGKTCVSWIHFCTQRSMLNHSQRLQAKSGATAILNKKQEIQ